MKLWLISQEVNCEYDTYYSAVVVAHTEEEAKLIHPNMGFPKFWLEDGPFGSGWYSKRLDGSPDLILTKYSAWCDPEYVKAVCIGETDQEFPHPVICASFNAG